MNGASDNSCNSMKALCITVSSHKNTSRIAISRLMVVSRKTKKVQSKHAHKKIFLKTAITAVSLLHKQSFSYYDITITSKIFHHATAFEFALHACNLLANMAISPKQIVVSPQHLCYW